MPQFDPSDLVKVLAGGAIASAGFLIKRLITGAGAQERVTRFAGLADIAAKMKQNGLSAGDIDAVAAFTGLKRRQSVLLVAAESMPSALEGDGSTEPEGYWTQYALNTRAAAALQTATAQLEEVLLQLEHYVGEDDLRGVQAIWEHFRDAQADLAASQYEGGSIAPLIRASEAEALTQQRLAWARAELEQRRAL